MVTRVAEVVVALGRQGSYERESTNGDEGSGDGSRQMATRVEKMGGIVRWRQVR